MAMTSIIALLLSICVLNSVDGAPSALGRSKRSVGRTCVDDIYTRSKSLSEVDIPTQRRVMASLTDDVLRPAGRNWITDYPDSALEMGRRFSEIGARQELEARKLELDLRRVQSEVDSGRLTLSEGKTKFNKLHRRIGKLNNLATKANLAFLGAGILRSVIEGKPAEAGKAIGFFVAQEFLEEGAQLISMKLGQRFLSHVNSKAMTHMVTQVMSRVGIKTSSAVVSQSIQSGLQTATKIAPQAAAAVVGLAFQAYGWYGFHKDLEVHNALMADTNAPEWQKKNSNIAIGQSAASETLGTVMAIVGVITPVGTLIAAVTGLVMGITNALVGVHLAAVAQVESTRDRLGGHLSDAEAGEIYARAWGSNMELPAHLADSIVMREYYRHVAAHLVAIASQQGYKAIFAEIEPFVYTQKLVMTHVDERVETISGYGYVSTSKFYICNQSTVHVPIRPLPLTEDSYASITDNIVPPTRLFDVGGTNRLICGPLRDTPRHVQPKESYTDPAISLRSCAVNYYIGGSSGKCDNYCPQENTVLREDTVYLSAFNERYDSGCHNAIGIRLNNASNNSAVLFHPISHIHAGGDQNVFLVNERTRSIVGGAADDMFIVFAFGNHARLDGGSGQNTLLLLNGVHISLESQKRLRNINHVIGTNVHDNIYAAHTTSFIDGCGGGDTIHLAVENEKHDLPDEISPVWFESTLKPDPDPTREMGDLRLPSMFSGCDYSPSSCLGLNCKKAMPLIIYSDILEHLTEFLLFTNDEYNAGTQGYSPISNAIRIKFHHHRDRNSFTCMVPNDIPSIDRIFLRIHGRYLIRPLFTLDDDPENQLSGYNRTYKAVALLVLDEQAASNPIIIGNWPIYMCHTTIWESGINDCLLANPRYRSLAHNPVQVALYKDDKIYAGSDGHIIALQTEPGNYSIYCLQNRFGVNANTILLGFSVTAITEMIYHPNHRKLEVVALDKRVSLFHYQPDVTQVRLQTTDGLLSFELPARTAGDRLVARNSTKSTGIPIQSLKLEVFPVAAETFSGAMPRLHTLNNPHFSIMKTLMAEDGRGRIIIVQDDADRRNLLRLSELPVEIDNNQQRIAIDMGLGSDIIVVDIRKPFTFHMHTHEDDIKRINLRPYADTCADTFEVSIYPWSGESDLILFATCQAQSWDITIQVLGDNTDFYRHLHIIGVNSYSTIEYDGLLYIMRTWDEHPMFPVIQGTPIVIPAELLDNTTAYMPHLERLEDFIPIRLNNSDLLLFDINTGGSLVAQNVTPDFHFSFENQLPDYARFQSAESNNSTNTTVHSIDIPDVAELPSLDQLVGAINAQEDVKLIPRSAVGVVDMRNEINDTEITQIDVHFSLQDPDNVVFVLPDNVSTEIVHWSPTDDQRSLLVRRPDQEPLTINFFDAPGENASIPERFVSILGHDALLPNCDMTENETDRCEIRPVSLTSTHQYELLKRLEAKEFGTDPPESNKIYFSPPLVLSSQSSSSVRLHVHHNLLPMIDAATNLKDVTISNQGLNRATSILSLQIRGKYINPPQAGTSRLVLRVLVPVSLNATHGLTFKLNTHNATIYKHYVCTMKYLPDGLVYVSFMLKRITSSLLNEIPLIAEISYISTRWILDYSELRVPLQADSCTLKRFGPHRVLEGKNDNQENRAIVIAKSTLLHELKIACTLNANADTGVFNLSQTPNISAEYVSTPRGKQVVRYFDVDALLSKNRSLSTIVVPLQDQALTVINYGDRVVTKIVNASDGSKLIVGLVQNISVAYPPDALRPLGVVDEYTKPQIYLIYQDKLESIS